MSVFVSKAKRGLDVTCAEINLPFIHSASQIARNNGVELKIIESDMTKNVTGSFDVIFMNPPYVKAHTIAEFGINPKSGEGRAGTVATTAA